VAGDQKKFQTAMMHADRFSEQGNWKDAKTAYRFALAEFPNNAAAIIGYGKAALATNEIGVAGRAFIQALKINPSNLEALSYIGDVHERTGNLDAAAETYLRMGNVYASRNDLDVAVDYWMRATKLTAGHTDAHHKLADALVKQGKLRLAAREYLVLAAIYQRQKDLARMNEFVAAAEAILPNDPGVRAVRQAVASGEAVDPAWIADNPQEPVESEPLVEDLTGEDPYGLDDLFGIGDAITEQSATGGLVESARQQATETLANLIFEDNDDPNVMVIMQALDAQSRNDTQEAISLYRQAVGAGFESPALDFNLGMLYREQGQLGEAAECLQEAANDHHFASSALFALGDTYYATNDLDLAVKHLVDAIASIDMQTVSGHRSYELNQNYTVFADNFLGHSDSERIRQFISSVQNFFSNPSWEQKVYEARMRMNSLSDEVVTMSLAEFLETPETEVMVTTLALTTEYMRQNFLMTASEECLRAIQRVPSFLPLHGRLAEIMLKQNRADDAINKFLYMAKVHQMRNQPEQAVNVYQRILKLAPMDVTVRSKLIDMYTSSDNMPEALDQYLVLADSYYQLAQVDRALEKYQEAIRLADSLENGDVWRKDALTHMADIYNQRFDWGRATGALEQLLKLNPGDEKVMRQLVSLNFKQNKTAQAAAVLDDLLAIYQRKNPSASLDLLVDLLEFYPNDMSLRRRLAVAYVQNNMVEQAIKEYDQLGEMQLESGQREEAIQTVQAIINLGPEDVEGYRRLLSQIGG
jgi:tetratricopeptide (TPR) repeat protein